jgi:hypothetical protein
MGPARPHNEQDRQCDLQPPQPEQPADVLSLIEENIRLRGLVIKLSELVLRNALDKQDR